MRNQFYTLAVITLSTMGFLHCSRTGLILFDANDSGSGGASGCTGAGSGCCDGTREGFTDTAQFPDIAACAGAWLGHVSNATILCEPGWHVCSPPGDPDDMAIVGTILFAQATDFAGCFAYDAAHDFSTCIFCTGLEHEDDMGGMGNACAYSDATAANSCTATGRVDADCCEGALGCSYSPTRAGAVCCRNLGSPLLAPPLL